MTLISITQRIFMMALLVSSFMTVPVWGADQPININEANAAIIADALHGIGLKKAKAIVAYRKRNGPFKTVEQLTQVKGVSKRLVNKNKKLIQLK